MRVMQVKYNSRVKNQQSNARKLFSLAVTNGNESGCKSNPVYNVDISAGNIISSSGPTNMCGEYSYVEKAPSHQQSYGLYLKRATMGIGAGGGGIGSQPSGGLARRVVDFPPNSGGTKGTFQKMLTFKRPQKFTTSNYIENKKSKAIRCEVMDKCSPRIPVTHNKTVTAAGGNFYVDGVITPTLTFVRGDTYVFDQSDNTNATHPFKFSTTNDGTHGVGVEYTDGVTNSGIAAGNAGATVTIVVPDTAPDTLYYYCPNHSGMGGSITVTTLPSLVPATKQNKLCYNNCSNKPCITEDLGYDDASDQINRRVAMRAGPSLTANYESEMMRNNGQSGCN